MDRYCLVCERKMTDSHRCLKLPWRPFSLKAFYYRYRNHDISFLVCAVLFLGLLFSSIYLMNPEYSSLLKYGGVSLALALCSIYFFCIVRWRNLVNVSVKCNLDED